MIKNPTKNRLYISILCIGIIFVGFAIYNITHVVLSHFGVEQRLGETIGRLLSSIVIVAVFRKLYGAERFRLNNANFGKGIAAGWFVLVAVILTFTLSVMEAQEYPFVMPSAYLLFVVVIEQLFVGIFEEFLFRGFLLNMFLAEQERNNSIGKTAAILISSILFGAVHLLNLFDDSGLILYTVSQVFYAIFIGIYFAALYLKTENIWVVSLYHAAVNLSGALPQIFHTYPEEATDAVADISMGAFWQNILFNALFVLAAFFIIRKSNKQKEA